MNNQRRHPLHSMKNSLSMRLLSFLATLCLLFVIPAKAAQSGDFTYTSTATEVAITGYTAAGGAVTIPGSIGGLPVTSIGNNAFFNRSGLTSVTIPNSVKSIGDYAFYDCYLLTSLTIPNSVTSIGNRAFSSCSGLTSVTIPNSVTSIGSSAFSYCTGLTSVAIGNSVASIGSSAFYYCTGLTSLTADAANPNYSSMDGVLFDKKQTTLIQYPIGKTGGYTIPNGVTSVGSDAFYYCRGLTSVTIPNSVTSIGSSAFSYCTGLTSVAIGDSVVSIGSNSFYSCSDLTSVTIGNSVTSIGSSAFSNCSGLTSVTIPNSVTSIGSSAFSYCTGLTSVAIGNSVASIGSSAFSNCTGLTGVTIPDSVTSIGSSAFSYCTGLTSAAIGNSVASIGNSAFSDCTGLTGVTIGNSVASIGNGAFLACPNLLSIYIKGNAPTLDATVFTSNLRSNVYYRLGTTGWTSTYGGLYTVPLGLPTITVQPSSVIANPGENAAFSVIAKTTSPLTLSYQWQKNGLVIQSATAESLHLNSIQSADVGTYTVIITNDIGSVSSAVTLTLNQGTLYTQSQYESAFQVGLNAGMTLGMATGRTQVTDFPNNYGLYSLSQVQALHVGTPLLTKDSASGKFKLTIGVEKSTNLVNFSPMAIPVGAATINAQGEVEFEFTSPDNAAFFRIKSH